LDLFILFKYYNILSLLTKKKFRGLISISKNKKKHQKITSIPKIKRLVEILMFNLKNESHVQVAKKKKWT
jgi:hypothetical protein